jgi:hypothetical protein
MATENVKITKSQLLAQVRAARPKGKDQRNKIVCALLGHSRIATMCFGYVYCGRCEDQVADKLMGSDAIASERVVIGHNCKTCRANYKKMDWRDKLYVADPFKKKKAA